MERAKLYWIRESQSHLQQDNKFQVWKHWLNLFVDESLLWRCKGRMSNSDLPSSAQMPILLDKGHHVTTLIVLDANQRVMHNGEKETLTELWSAYWVARVPEGFQKWVGVKHRGN
jgi:hypothetical protein